MQLMGGSCEIWGEAVKFIQLGFSSSTVHFSLSIWACLGTNCLISTGLCLFDKLCFLIVSFGRVSIGNNVS